MPNSITSLNEEVFAYCSNLASVVLPSSVKSIGSKAFEGCDKLISIECHGEPAIFSKDSFDQSAYEIAKVYIPDGSLIEYLGSDWTMFKWLGGFENRLCSDNMFNYRIVLNDDPQAILVSGNYRYIKTAEIPDRITIESADGTAARYKVVGIARNAFKDCTYLTSVSINTTRSEISQIGASAFNGCKSLKSISLNDKLRVIGGFAFYNTSLVNAILPDSLETLGQNAFSFNSSLENVDFGTGLKYIPEYAFEKCSSLRYIRIDENIESISKGAFQSSGLETVYIGSNVKTISAEAFYDCLNLDNFIIEDCIDPISLGEIFKYDNGFCLSPITTMYIGREIEGLSTMRIGTMKNLTIGNLVREIGPEMFRNCHSLTSLKLGSGIKCIKEAAFSGCSLKSVTIPSNVLEIDDNAFYGNELTTVNIGAGLQAIGNNAFSSNVNTVAITAQVPPVATNTTFGNYAGTLYLQESTPGKSILDIYYDTDYCWYRFNSRLMVVADRIETDDTKLKYTPGTTQQLKAKVMPENATLPQIFWYSTNTDIATVDNDGLVTYHALVASNDQPDIAACKIIAKTLYANGPEVEFTVNGISEVENISIDSKNDDNIDISHPYKVYNINGVLVGSSSERLPSGVYILQQGTSTRKIFVN